MGFGVKAAWAEQSDFDTLESAPTHWARIYDDSSYEVVTNRSPETWLGNVSPEDEFQGISYVNYTFSPVFTYQGLGIWFYHALGAVSSVANVHTYTIADDVADHGISLALDLGLTPAAYKAHWVRGAKINSMTVTLQNGENPRISFEGVGAEPTLSGVPGTAVYPDTATEKVKFSDASVEISGTSYNMRSATINYNANITTDDSYLGYSSIAEPFRAGKTEVTVEFSLDYNKDLYDKLISTTDSILGTGVITLSGTAHSYEFHFDELRLESGSDELTESAKTPMTFTARAYDNGHANGAFWIVASDGLAAYNTALS